MTSLIIGFAEGLFKFLLIGGVLLLGSAGAFLIRLFLSGENIAKKAVEQIEKENEEQRTRELYNLYQKLSRDGDIRTHRLLKDLINIGDSFRKGKEVWSDDLNLTVFMDITSKIDRLFEESVKGLGNTLILLKTVNNISSKKAKQPLVKRREQIIKNVEKSIEQIGKTLVKVEELKARKVINWGKSALENICSELDVAIDIAEKVEKRLHDDKQYSESEFLEAATE